MITPFNNNKYKELQKTAIKKRISNFGKLYIEVGGKLFDDNHASRVLPGFEPNVKMQILSELKENLEIIFCLNANHIIQGKIRADNGLTYAEEVLRLYHLMTNEGFSVLGIVVTFYTQNELVVAFEKKCETENIKVFHSYFIENYPNNVDFILSKDGFGKNDYIETTKNLILVSAPGANSGKMETCLSQLYGDKEHGVSSGYAKYETFPVWNLPLNHLTNVAYEMATADLGDKNMVDPYYKKAYGKTAINYNRDIDSFPILSNILNKINGCEIYKSPTEMGINSVGLAIDDDKAVQEASFKEIERRHKKHLEKYADGKFSKEQMAQSEKIYKTAKQIYKNL